MDEKMMKAGGAAKRQELIKAFGDLSITNAKTRDYTQHEKRINDRGDDGQGENLKDKRANRR